METGKDLELDTLLQHYGEDAKVQGAVVSPIFQNSLFLFESSDELISSITRDPSGPPYHYSRVSNPTMHIAEQKLALLEGAEACKVTGSGMAAITCAIFSCVQKGSHVVAVDTAYGPAKTLLSNYLSRFGVETTFVTGTSTDELLEAIRPETSLIYLESPSSILFRLQDVPEITKVARQRGIATIIDNTYCTPLYFQPLKLGVDIVCHSATKYLGGHSDIVAGAICASNERIANMTRNELSLFGNVLPPFPAWLLVRGLRTLSLRLKRHEQTANEVAAWLEARPEIARVHHLGLPSYPQRELYLKLMKGCSGLFSFEPKVQDPDKVKAFCDALEIFGRGISWGGFESLVVPVKARSLDLDPHWVIRLSCGLEDPKDLIRDLEQAMPHLR